MGFSTNDRSISRGALPEVAAVILTFNEARYIESCIESLGWADRVVVFDSFSQDDTVDLAEAAGAEVLQHTFHDFAQQRNAALSSISTDWIFFVDADEQGTPELAEEIRQVTASRTEAGWYVPRHNYIFGKLTRGGGWYPDHQLRLFKHGRVRYERPVHEVAVVDGQIGYLTNPLLHQNYRDLSHFRLKQRAYTSYDATILKEQGIRPWPHKFVREPLRQFWWRFITLRGYKDGFHGLQLGVLMAYYEWVKYLKLAWLWSGK